MNNEEPNPFFIGIPVIIIVALIIAILISEEGKRRGENNLNNLNYGIPTFMGR